MLASSHADRRCTTGQTRKDEVVGMARSCAGLNLLCRLLFGMGGHDVGVSSSTLTSGEIPRLILAC